MDLIGKTVRWENPKTGEWFTARITARNPRMPDGYYRGVYVSRGNTRPRAYRAGMPVSNLHVSLITVIDSEPVVEDEECE